MMHQGGQHGVRLNGLQFRHWPIAYKLAILFSILLTAIVIVAGLMAYDISRRSMENQIKHYIPQVLDQVNVRLEDYVNDVKSLSQMILVEPYSRMMEEAISGFESSGTERRLEDTIKLHEALSFITFNPSKDYVGVLFYTDSGQVYVRQSASGIWLDASVEEQPWFRDVDGDQLTPTVLGTIPFTLFGDNPFIGDFHAFSVVQPFRKTQTKLLKGMIQIVGTLDAIRDIMRDIDFGPDSRLYVLDNRNRIVFASDRSLLGTPWESGYDAGFTKMQGDSGSSIQTMDGDDMLVSYHRSRESGWKVVGVIPLQNVSQEADRLKLWIVVWIALGILGVILLSSMLSVSLTNPLRKLTRITRMQVDLSAPPVNMGQVGDDEIGQLSQSFRHMMQRMQLLSNEVLHEKLLHQEAEIRALQSQINPHFLHNTLETIRMTIRNGNFKRGEQGLVELGHMLRYHATNANEMVPLKTEIQFIQSYISIQRLRFGERLSVKMEVEEGVLEVRVPGLLLQPLVENAITHGASPYDQRIRVTVRVKRQREHMVCSIIDEGQGMSPDKLDTLLESLRQHPRAPGGRIGLENIYQRLQLVFGAEARFYIESMESAGTIVAIHIPLAENDMSAYEGECR
ncbi:sensor histidine kinase [Paenibacillus daejeonensis]|uniref:sensor histidine kinase n=1 Tax=Paenibacillus daejeonensis TaxID=135193 RepID=UPI001B7FA7C8|nr:sensor histidine kinase [Paenibacillus daejeonensis]